MQIVTVFALVASASSAVLPNAFSENMAAKYNGSEISENGTQFDLKINDTFSQDFDSLKIKLLNVTSDSRCPQGVTCVWQGEVTALVEITVQNQDLGNFSLSTVSQNNPLVFGKYALLLTQVKPDAVHDKTIPSSNYTLTFTLSNANTNDIQIVDAKVIPATVTIGDTFAINATLVNNSTDTISIRSDCLTPFSVSFDSHAEANSTKPCIYAAISRQLGPGQSMTVTGPGSNAVYQAVSTGTANATITFSYTIGNQTSSDLVFVPNPAIVSKSILFTVNPIPVSLPVKTPVTKSPLVQFKSGTAAKDVECQQGFHLAIKNEDGTPACLKQSTASILAERGWATIQLPS